jgi:hypothetical protein
VEAATAPRRNSETPHNEDFPNMDHNCSKKNGILSLGWGMMSEQVREMKIQNWSKMAMNREEWKRIVEKAKTHRVVAPREE